MATSTTSSDSTTDSTETDEQDTEGTEEQDTEETSGQSADGTEDDSTKATQPDKKDPAKQALLADLHKERKALKTASASLAALETEVKELRPVKETLDAVQAKYDRLEAFLQTAGGALGKALDSRTFTKALFETDTDITEIVKDWNKANPTATSTALGASSASPASKAPDMNALLRSAINK